MSNNLDEIMNQQIFEKKITDLTESYVEMAEELFFAIDAIMLKQLSLQNPFNDNDIYGDFIYMTNRFTNRYSYLYENLESDEVYHKCTLSMGYTAIFLCKSIKYFKGSGKLNFEEIEFKNEIATSDRKDKYCVFRDPRFHSSMKNGFSDAIGLFLTLENALSYAKYCRDTKGLSTLVVIIKEHINWH